MLTAFSIRLCEMNVDSISEGNAFSEGASLWIMKNDPSLVWWKKIDLNSKYLLSQSLLKQKTQTVSQLQNIITATNLKLTKNNYVQNHLLLGSEDHFLNRWVLLWNDLSDPELVDLIEEVTLKLKAPSIRFFSDSKIISKVKARLSASSVNISYIENI